MRDFFYRWGGNWKTAVAPTQHPRLMNAALLETQACSACWEHCSSSVANIVYVTLGGKGESCDLYVSLSEISSFIFFMTLVNFITSSILISLFSGWRVSVWSKLLQNTKCTMYLVKNFRIMLLWHSNIWFSYNHVSISTKISVWDISNIFSSLVFIFSMLKYILINAEKIQND